MTRIPDDEPNQPQDNDTSDGRIVAVPTATAQGTAHVPAVAYGSNGATQDVHSRVITPPPGVTSFLIEAGVEEVSFRFVPHWHKHRWASEIIEARRTLIAEGHPNPKWEAVAQMLCIEMSTLDKRLAGLKRDGVTRRTLCDLAKKT
jgi:hypothetical protein